MTSHLGSTKKHQGAPTCEGVKDSAQDVRHPGDGEFFFAKMAEAEQKAMKINPGEAITLDWMIGLGESSPGTI